MIQELYIRLLTPLARALVRVKPNTVSSFSLVTGCLAGVSFWLTSRDPAFFFAGGLLVAVSGVADSLDGLMARMHGNASAAGDFLDHFFDRVVDVAILVGLALSRDAHTTFGLAAVIMVLLSSYLGTQIHASFGTRYYSGMGKAELFVGLVLGSAVLGVLPDTTLHLAGREVSLVDLFFVLVLLLTVQSITHRVRLALRLAAEQENR